MNDLSITELLIGSIIGAVITALFSLLNKRRARFIYSVRHIQVGESADDPVFGSIEVLYNKTPAKNLWLSTLEITNTSLQDFNDVPIQISATNQTILLNQTIKVNDAFPFDICWEEDYKNRITAPDGDPLTDEQAKLYHSVRRFKFPVVNRGDKLTFTYLTHTPGDLPEIHASVEAAGTKCKYRRTPNLPHNFTYTMLRAVIIGLVCTIPLLILVMLNINNPQYSAGVSWLLGLLTGSFGLGVGWIWDRLRVSLFN